MYYIMAYKTRSRTQSKQSRKNKSRSQSRGGSSQNRDIKKRSTTRKVKSAPNDWKPSKKPIRENKIKYSINLKRGPSIINRY